MSQLRRIKARSLLEYEATDLFDILTGRFILVFDDGEMQVNAYDTSYSAFAWEFHRKYPKTPMLMKHHLRAVLKGNRLSTSNDLTLIGNCLESTYDAYRQEGIKRDPELTSLATMVGNNAFSFCTQYPPIEECTMSVDILDFMEALDEPEIFEANQAIQNHPYPTAEDVLKTHSIVHRVLNDPAKLPYNAIAMEYRSKLLKAGQVWQCISARGALTDMNSRIYRIPITRGYAEGIRSLYDSMIESRSAAKSSFYAAEALKQSEYFSRRLQFVAQTVQNLHDCDCGTHQYLDWTMRDKLLDDNGQQIRPSDLITFQGKLYLDEVNNVLKPIKPNDRELIGRKIKMRSPFFCAHPDPVGICTTCFGDLSLAVPQGTNIGQLASTYMAKQASQNLLSNKHLDRNATLDKLRIAPEEQKFIKAGRDNSSYLLANNLRGKDVKIIIPGAQAQSLVDIFEVADVTDLPERYVTELDTIKFEVFDGKIADTQPVKIAVHGRFGSLTHDMLNFMRDKKWKVSPDGDYIIDMAGWDFDKTFIILPQKHFNNSDHVENVAKMLESRVSEMRSRDKTVSPEHMLREFADYVNWKLDVNGALLEVVLYSTMIVSAERNDYSLPKPGTSMGFGVHSLIMEKRSASVAMAYEDQYERIVSPSGYLETNRMDHPFDALLMPYEVHGPHGQ